MTYTDEWFIVSETHAPDLVCHRRIGHVADPESMIAWDEVSGPVMLITEHEYRVNDDGTLGALTGTRTRLVVREVGTAHGNGSEYGITPLVVDDDETYKRYIFTAREKKPTVLINDDSSELRDLRSAHAQVMRTLDEITRLRDDVVQIRDAALRAASATREARGR